MQPDLVCFSHLRWDFVFQRPNHLMSRAARDRRVFFIEEPVPGPRAELRVLQRDGVTVVTPVMPREEVSTQRRLLDRLLTTEAIRRPDLWFYSPMALRWSDHVSAGAVAYDCMDELRNFRDAPAGLPHLERRLLDSAGVVFTGGRALWEAKRRRRPDAHLFPSSIDHEHFRRARSITGTPAEIAAIPGPRLIYVGVVDERMDLDLVARLADREPDWQVVMVGPTAKVSPEELPVRPNIHWLGARSYPELPAYLAAADVALMPFARNEATRYISPTKTPEYLCAGLPVVSTRIPDVVEPYARLGLVHIGDDVDGFHAAVRAAMRDDRERRIEHVDRHLGAQSWDATWRRMSELLEHARPLAARPLARRPDSVPTELRPAADALAIA